MSSSGSNPIQTKENKEWKTKNKHKDAKKKKAPHDDQARKKAPHEVPPWRRKTALPDHLQMQPVHLTIHMVNEMPPEDRQTMFGPNRCCLEQMLLRQICLNAKVAEMDLTSGEKFPWKQMFRCIPFEKAKTIIGSGITKFTFRLLSDKHRFEITCLDGTKWSVMEHDALPKRIANDNEEYTWCEFLDYYGDDITTMWKRAEPVDETDAVFKRIDAGQLYYTTVVGLLVT